MLHILANSAHNFMQDEAKLCFSDSLKELCHLPDWLVSFNPNLFGGGGKFAPQAVFCYSSETVGARLLKLCGLLLAYYTSFGILFGHQGPKLLPW